MPTMVGLMVDTDMHVEFMEYSIDKDGKINNERSIPISGKAESVLTRVDREFGNGSILSGKRRIIIDIMMSDETPVSTGD